MSFVRRGLTDLSLQGSLTAAKLVRRGLLEGYSKNLFSFKEFFQKTSHSPLLTRFPDSGEACKERANSPLLTRFPDSGELQNEVLKVRSA